jgi:hypothetical protein
MSKLISIHLGKGLDPMLIIRKSELRVRERALELSRPIWKVILKLSMTLVCYGSRSVLSSPLGGVKLAELGGNDVGCLLDSIERSSKIYGEGPSCRIMANKTMAEKRSSTDNVSIAEMQMPRIGNAEFVLIPIKGR